MKCNSSRKRIQYAVVLVVGGSGGGGGTVMRIQARDHRNV